MSTVIFARMSAKKCKGRVDEGASQMFVTSTPTGSLIFFSPDKPDFHIKVQGCPIIFYYYYFFFLFFFKKIFDTTPVPSTLVDVEIFRRHVHR